MADTDFQGDPWRRSDDCDFPNKTLTVLAHMQDERSVRVPVTAAGKGAVNGKPTVYVCHGFTCFGPVTE